MFKCRFKQQSSNNYRSPIIAYNKYRTQQRYSIYANTTPTYSNQYGIVVQESRTNEARTTNAGTMTGTKGNIYLISNDNTLSWVDGSAGGGVLNENHMYNYIYVYNKTEYDAINNLSGTRKFFIYDESYNLIYDGSNGIPDYPDRTNNVNIDTGWKGTFAVDPPWYDAVSYTHLTLPTKPSVVFAVGGGG